MYSDSDIDGYVSEVFSESSDLLTNSEEASLLLEKHEQAISTLVSGYACVFEASDGFFRTQFGSHFLSPDAEDQAMAAVCTCRLSATDVAELLHVPAEEQIADNLRNNGDASPSSAAMPSDHPLTATSLQMSESLKAWVEEGKSSPASRFLCANRESCILIPVDKALNRTMLCSAHQELFVGTKGVGGEGLDIVPGYDHSEAIGWALPLSTDPAVLDVLKSLHPGWRGATPSDVRFWTKSQSKTGSTCIANKVQSKPSRRTWTRGAAMLMLSKERLLARIAAAGDWSNITFVAVDTEAYAVMAHSVPLPAEYAFLPIHSSHASTSSAVLSPLHFFCHPGNVEAENEENVLYNCLNTHLIPYHSATFLTDNFYDKAVLVDRQFVRNPSVILISKGAPSSPTLMDMQAVRWLYAAAALQWHNGHTFTALEEKGALEVGNWIPSAEDIYCFDISVLEAVALERGGIADSQGTLSLTHRPNRGARREENGYCWYHSVVNECDLIQGDVHCAMHDAYTLAGRIKAVLPA